MTPVKAYLQATIAAMAIAFGVLSAPANATVSTPFGSIRAGGFGINPSSPSFAVTPHCMNMKGPYACFGIGGASDQQALSVSTPFGGFSGPGFGIVSPFGFGVSPAFGGWGIGNGGPGAGGYYTGLGIGNVGGVPSPGMTNQQELSVSTPFGGFSGPGFGLPMIFLPGGRSFGIGNGGPGAGGYYTGFGINPAYSFGMNDQQALSVRTPWGGVSVPGFGVSPAFGGWGLGGPGYPPGVVPFFGLPNPYPPLPANFGIGGSGYFGVSTPWGGMNMGGFGVGDQSPVMPINMPYPY